MRKLIGLMAVVVLLVSGCGTKEKQADEPLKIGVMPAVDAAPIYVAAEKGYFKDEGIDVEVTLFTNAQDRQSALQTGGIDGGMSDMIALITNVQSGFEIKGTTMTDGMFPILKQPESGESEVVSVAVMEVSVANYLADLWLGANYDLEKVYINEIPARLEMIKSGNVDMGVFPEPMATMGALSGLEKVFYNSDEPCPDIFVFTQSAIDTKKESIKAFHRALDRAVMDLQLDDGIGRDLLIEKLNLNSEIRDLIEMPEYKKTNLPDDQYVIKMMNWTAQTIGKEINLDVDAIFEREFVNP
ncbi:ABC transporter substrate-binding protein [Fusibacter tunisiensis]|uniref:NitT/TauT family transport system substrate-binding protein n=1 Tax=Fusibacter tunisiensis TaxID=1008308 RepID=A0ABS2MUJ0_9FIRM|nr:ABC transporter substrate-binding protein [Fusibacter tunisiensis]MBM7563005.1 NitT/TauT family transport system substrate-binding protein [Fusibacter tunisiensis]